MERGSDGVRKGEREREGGREGWGRGKTKSGQFILSSKTLTSASTTATLPVATAKCKANNKGKHKTITAILHVNPYQYVLHYLEG